MRKIKKEDLQIMSKEEIFQILKEVSNELQQPDENTSFEELSIIILDCIEILENIDNRFVDDMK